MSISPYTMAWCYPMTPRFRILHYVGDILTYGLALGVVLSYFRPGVVLGIVLLIKVVLGLIGSMHKEEIPYHKLKA